MFIGVKVSHLITALAALLVFTGSAVAEHAPLSLADIVKIRQPANVEMSPNGKLIAYTLTRPPVDAMDENAVDGLKELYVVSKQGKLVPMIIGGDAIGQLQWSSNSSTLWFLAKRFNDSHVAIYRISTGGGEAIKAVRFSADIKGFRLHEDQTRLLFWSTENVASSNTAQATTADVYHSVENPHVLWEMDLTKPDQKARLIYSDSHVLDAVYRDKNQGIVLQVAPSILADDVTLNKALILIDQQGQEQWRARHVGKMGKMVLSPNNKTLAFIGSNDITDTSAGRLMITHISEDNSTELMPDFEGQIEDIAWQSNNNILFIAHKGTSSLLARKRIDRVSNSYKRLLTPQEILRKLSASSDGRELALIADSSTHAKELFWFEDSNFRRYSNSNPWLSQRRFGHQRVVSYSARDGVEIEGVLITPKRKVKTPLPTILFVHGGPEVHISNGWLNRYSHPAHVAVSKGFAVFFPNYRGSTGRGVSFAKSGQGDYAGKEFDDLVDAKQFLISEGITDPSRVGISGASYGGYAAAWGATRLSEHFAASVSGMGIGNQISKFGTTDIPREMYHQHALSWPWQNWQWMLERSPVFYAGQSKTPLLLLHGEQDKRVHFSQSVELYQYLTLQSQTPVRLVLYPDEGHGFRRSANKLDYSQRLMRWMEHFLVYSSTDLPSEMLPQETQQ